jgi:hypothetical protein
MKSSRWTFPSYAILAKVGLFATPKVPGSYGGQLSRGDKLSGLLAKSASAVWKLRDSSTSAAEAVDVLYVPKAMGTTKWFGGWYSDYCKKSASRSQSTEMVYWI